MAIVIVALALVGGAVALHETHPLPTSPSEEGEELFAAVSASAKKQATYAKELADIERQLNMALRTGGMSARNYKSFDSKLKKLERKKVDTRNARALMKQVSVGGKQPPKAVSDNNPPKQPPLLRRINGDSRGGISDADELRALEQGLQTALKTGGISPQEHKKMGEQLKALESRKVNTANARAMYAKLSVGGTEPSKAASAPANNFENAGAVWWRFEHDKNKWVPQGTPPASCPPLVFDSPVDISKARAILYPGQQRGLSIQDYKAHGGFLLSSPDIEVRMPYDGYVMQGARFTENGHIQYALDMISECGILQRFGHLYELTPKFQAIVEKFPAPKENDSRTTPVRPMVKVMKGELIATKVGVPWNPGMDWGVMDLRTENKAAQDAAYREKYAWQRSYAYHGLCWLDYLSEEEQTLAKALPGGDGRMGKTSDYCGK